jgi:hypothetical protein
MKTTVEISDQLLAEARRLASQRGTTVRALIEEGLREVLRQQKRRRPAFRVRAAAFRGQGVQPGVREGDWTQIRELVYQGRGA